MHSGQHPGNASNSDLTHLYGLLLSSLRDKSQFASQKTQVLLKQYIAEAMNQRLDTTPLKAALAALQALSGASSTQSVSASTDTQNAIITAVCDFHLSHQGEDEKPQPTTLPGWISSMVSSIVGKPSTTPARSCNNNSNNLLFLVAGLVKPTPCYINHIPNDILLLLIAVDLQFQELMHLTQTSRRFYGLFKPQRDELSCLSYVMKANEQSANYNLMKLKAENPDNWRYVLKKVRGLEPCGRQWKSVSPLEYAAWIGDMFMVKMLLSHLPTEGLQEALGQLLKVNTNDLEHGPRMAPFTALINAYTPKDTSAIRTQAYCTQTLGNLQLQLSCFGLQWFCDTELLLDDSNSFSPDLSGFNRAPRRQFMLNGQPWDPFSVPLGKECFIYKYSSVTTVVGASNDPLAVQNCIGRHMLRNLCAASSNQLNLEIKSLKERIPSVKPRDQIT